MSAAAENPHPIPLTESEVLIRGFLSANPTLDADLGPIEVMTDRYTNEEWAAQIAETQKAVLKEVESGKRASKVYEGPKMRDGNEALKELAKTVDHTVLKLDATSTQIDTLCSEARTEEFKVRRYIVQLFSKSHVMLTLTVRLRPFELGPTLRRQPQGLLRRRSSRRWFPRRHARHVLQAARSTCLCRCWRLRT
jgi:hypothetical protein